MPIDHDKRYSVRLTRRQIEALVHAARQALSGSFEPQDLVGLYNGKNELATLLAAIDAYGDRAVEPAPDPGPEPGDPEAAL